MIKSAQITYRDKLKTMQVITTMAEMTRINTKMNSTTYE